MPRLLQLGYDYKKYKESFQKIQSCNKKKTKSVMVEFSKYDAQIRKKLELFFEVKCIEKKKYEKYKVVTERKQKCAML